MNEKNWYGIIVAMIIIAVIQLAPNFIRSCINDIKYWMWKRKHKKG